MGASALRSKPTVHRRDLDKDYKFRQTNKPRSLVSPLESNGENWKYPPIKVTPQNRQVVTLSDIPIEEVPSNKRLSRPFEQPHPMADSSLRQKSAQVPKKKAAPPPLTIPTPAHQPGRQPEENSNRENQASSERSDRRQKNETRVQRSTQHQGWNPLKETRQERNADAHPKNDSHAHGRGRDLERQDEHDAKSRKRMDPQERASLRCFIFVVLMAIVSAVVIVIIVKKGVAA